jgi:hypothetical protein
MEINSFAIIRILMIRPSVMLGLLFPKTPYLP